MTSYADETQEILINFEKRKYNSMAARGRANVKSTPVVAGKVRPNAERMSIPQNIARKKKVTLSSAIKKMYVKKQRISKAAAYEKAASAAKAKTVAKAASNIRISAYPKSIAKSEKQVYININKTKSAAPLPTSIIFTILIFTVIFMFLVINYSQISTYTNEINKIENNITDYKKEQSKLNILLNQRDDLSYIEQKAISNGMVKTDGLAKKYVNSSDGDKIEVVKEDGSELHGASVLMSGVVSLFSEFIHN